VQFRTLAAVASATLLAILVACSGRNASPVLPNVVPPNTLDSVRLAATSTPAPTQWPPPCQAAAGAIGKAIVVVVSGTVKGATFSAQKSAHSYWSNASLSLKPGPPSAPAFGGAYIYYGTYRLSTGKTGCFALATSLNGSPLPSAYGHGLNAYAQALPNVVAPLGTHVVVSGKSAGLVYPLLLQHLSARGGSGKGSLLSASGRAFATITVTLAGRYQYFDPPAKIVFTSDSSVILPTAGSTYQFAATLQQTQGAPPGKLSWKSSNPSAVSVDQTGKVTARANLGSATIEVSAPGAVTQVATVLIAVPAPNTIVLQNAEIVTASPSRVVLHADSATRAIRKGSVLVSGAQAGILATVVSVKTSGNQIDATVARASLTSAFKQLNVNVAGAPAQYRAQRVGRRLVIFDRFGNELRSLDIGTLECTNDSGGSIAIAVSGPSATFSANVQPVFILQTSGLTVEKFQESVTVTLQATLSSGAVAVSGALNAAFTCSAELGDLPVAPIPVGPIIISPTITVKGGVGGSLGTSGAITFTGPTITRNDVIEVGLAYENGTWQQLNSDTPTGGGSLTPWSLKPSVSISGSVGPFVEVDAGIAAYVFGVELLKANFASAKVSGLLELSIASPFGYTNAGYAGPSWDLALALTLALSADISAGKLQPLLDAVGIKAIKLTIAPYTAKTKFLQSPGMTVSISPASGSSSQSFTLSSKVLCSTPFCLSYEGDELDFWAFPHAGDGFKIASTKAGSNGTTVSTMWTPGYAYNNQAYSIYAYLSDKVFGPVGLPYVSASGAPVTIGSPSPSPTPSPPAECSPSNTGATYYATPGPSISISVNAQNLATNGSPWIYNGYGYPTFNPSQVVDYDTYSVLTITTPSGTGNIPTGTYNDNQIQLNESTISNPYNYVNICTFNLVVQ